MTRISDLDFPFRVRLENTAERYEGLVVEASADPLSSPGAFIRYRMDDAQVFGYIQTRLATEVRGAPWGMGLLYDIAADAPAKEPRRNRTLDGRFTQRAEVEFRTVGAHGAEEVGRG